MTHSTKGGGRSEDPGASADKSEQHDEAPSARGAGDQQGAKRASNYRGSGDGGH